MEIDPKKFAAEILELPRTPAGVNAKCEAAFLHELVSREELAEQLSDYTNPSVVGVGGSGLILRATYDPSGGDRALKFPRKRNYEEAVNDPGVVKVDLERAALEKVSHQNITRLYDAFKLPNKIHYCMITEYIEGVGDNSLDEYIIKLICNEECRNSDEHLIISLKQFAKIVYKIADALSYLHREAKLLHFDIKPENLLISPSGTPFVTDFGFSRDLEGHHADEKVEVGFTWKYAHPRLQDPHRGALVTNVPQKAKTPLMGSELSAKFDLFSFGRTLQELLGILYVEYGERIHSRYIFNYLHVVACLCLDGKNGSTANPTARGQFISDTAMDMSPKLYQRSAFAEFDDVCICVQRLVGLRRLEDEIEETDRWYRSTIKVTENASTILTPRVSGIIDHPALQRLQKERQLGLLDSIFPTATHTRFQHTLGSYHAATLYLAALYYDPENPLFRALINIKECKALLVAMLIHDIGHTAYGHELEEIDDDLFDHHQYVETILCSESFKDTKGRTLKKVIEGTSDGSWDVRLRDVFSIFESAGPTSNPICGVLHDILDSQIDADKFDYLVRDTVEARVTYGFGIDQDRFLRSLTTYTTNDGTLRLAVKQKGAASAEAFAHARYQLFQSMYWHHTFRATKTMLIEAIQRINDNISVEAPGESQNMFDHPFKTAYIRHVIGAEDYSPPGKKPKRKGKRPKTAADVIEARLAKPRTSLPPKFRDDRFIIFLLKLAEDQKARSLIYDLVNRNYYKRLLEISPAQLSRPAWEKFRDKFKKDRAKIQNSVEVALFDALRSSIQSQSKTRESLSADETLSRLSEIESQKTVFLVDVPLRGWFASNEPPIYVSDYKRRYFRAGVADRGYEQRKDFWINMLGDSMKAAAYIRVFCESEVHAMVVSVMKADQVFDAVADAIPELNFR